MKKEFFLYQRLPVEFLLALRLLVLSLLIAILCLWPNQASAQTNDTGQVEAMMTSIISILQLTTFVDANESFCTEQAPETTLSVQEAASEWRNSGGIHLLNQVRTAHPKMLTQIAQLEVTLRAEMLQNLSTRAVGRESEWCLNFPILLEGSDWNVQANYAAELEQLRDFLTKITGEEPLPQPVELAPVRSPSFNEVIAAGINPLTQFIPDEFRCYGEFGTYDTRELIYSRPHLVIQITGPNQYLSTMGGGTFQLERDTEFPDIEWLSGPLADSENSSLRYDEYGQSFRVEDFFNCYQQGASENRALVEFRLKEPVLGSYACADVETNQTQALELLPGNSYRFANFTGNYELTELFDEGDTSRISWLSGPFSGEHSYYGEQEGTGYRGFSLSVSEAVSSTLGGSFSSSSQLVLTCSSKGKATSFQKYSEGTAPSVALGDIQLEGIYYGITQSYNGLMNVDEPYVMQFFPNGYLTLLEGINKIDCNRNAPSGAPVCASYQVVGNQLIVTAFGQANRLSFFYDSQNGTLVLDGESLERIEAVSVTQLDGLFVAFKGSVSGYCGIACSINSSEQRFDFRPNNTFVYSSSSDSSSYMTTSIANSYAGANSNVGNSGRYSLAGNTLSLTLDNGITESVFIHRVDETSLVIGESIYHLKSR